MEHNVYEVLKAVWPEWHIVGKPLGSGSFSTVYKVERKDIVRDAFAALKVIVVPDEEELADLKAQRLSQDEISQTLKRQVEDYAAEIRHMYSVRGEKNVVFIEDYRVYEIPDSLTWYLLIRMELLTPLNTYLSEHPMEETDVIRLGLDLCTALAACRKKLLVHRDIARKNIFVDDEGNFKLGDFGVARTVERSTRVSSAGTPSYMAPEAVKATMIRSNIDAAARADIYSLGMVLYELSNGGKQPFMEDLNYSSRYAAYQRRIDGEALPAPKYVSEELQKVILKACAYDPEKRFQSAAEMKKALAAIRNREAAGISELSGIISKPAEKQPAGEKKEKARGWIKWIAVLSAVAVLCVLWFTVLQPIIWHEKTDEKISGEDEQAQETSGDTAVGYAETGIKRPLETVGSIVEFGRYEQNDKDDGPEPIEWIVLDVRDGMSLLVSRYLLDRQPYHSAREDITWENCSLRTWLNTDFLAAAFSAEEQEAIPETMVDNSDTQGETKWQTTGGGDTADRIFLLSYAEAWRYFETDEARRCRLTVYAEADAPAEKDLNVFWWLRSPGSGQRYALNVSLDGTRHSDGVTSERGFIRPALWVRVR